MLTPQQKKEVSELVDKEFEHEDIELFLCGFLLEEQQECDCIVSRIKKFSISQINYYIAEEKKVTEKTAIAEYNRGVSEERKRVREGIEKKFKDDNSLGLIINNQSILNYKIGINKGLQTALDINNEKI